MKKLNLYVCKKEASFKLGKVEQCTVLYAGAKYDVTLVNGYIVAGDIPAAATEESRASDLK